MDPNKALKIARNRAKQILGGLDKVGLDLLQVRAYRLAEMFDALDKWISNGGFLPEDWQTYPMRIGETETERMAGSEAVKVSLEDYHYATQYYQGWCVVCKAFTRDQTEPDAHDYDCPECGNNTVVGAEDALVCMYIDIEE